MVANARAGRASEFPLIDARGLLHRRLACGVPVHEAEAESGSYLVDDVSSSIITIERERLVQRDAAAPSLLLDYQVLVASGDGKDTETLEHLIVPSQLTANGDEPIRCSVANRFVEDFRLRTQQPVVIRAINGQARRHLDGHDFNRAVRPFLRF